MKKIIIIAAAIAVSGCETMFAHYRMYDFALTDYAKRNVISNACVDKGHYDPSLVYEYNYVAATFLDFAVINESFYKSEYARFSQHLSQTSDIEIKSICEESRPKWAPFTEDMKADYIRASGNVTRARQAELSQIGASLENLGNSMHKSAAAINNSYYAPPEVSFIDNESKGGNHYLINTRNGLVQCKTTKKGYVFCF